MVVVDANVLIYAVNSQAPHHETARTWLDDAVSGDETVGTAWVVMLAFLRLTTHPATFERPLAPSRAATIVREWLGQPTVRVVEPTARHLDVLASLLAEAGTAANLVNDAHIAALTIEHDATLVSFDADFGRFRGLRVMRPGG